MYLLLCLKEERNQKSGLRDYCLLPDRVLHPTVVLWLKNQEAWCKKHNCYEID